MWQLSKCWTCQNATGGCSWSAIDEKTGAVRFEPVEGWKAKPTKKKGYRRDFDSYHVYECPEYKEDEGYESEA